MEHLTSVMASFLSFSLFFTFSFSLSLLIAACVSLSECYPAFPPPHSTPTLTVFLGTALKNKCTPTVSIWTIGIWQGLASIRLSHLKESATQKWGVVELVGGSQFFMSWWKADWDKSSYEAASLLRSVTFQTHSDQRLHDGCLSSFRESQLLQHPSRCLDRCPWWMITVKCGFYSYKILY